MLLVEQHQIDPRTLGQGTGCRDAEEDGAAGANTETGKDKKVSPTLP